MAELTEMEKLIEEFLSFLKRERQATENTISNYGSDLRQFGKFCLEHPKKPSLTTVNQEVLQDYYGELKVKEYAGSSIYRKFSCLRSFFDYLLVKGVVQENPAEKIAILKPVPREVPRALSNEEIERLLAIPAKSSKPWAIRDLLILELILATGMRLDELIALNLKMVNLDPRWPTLRVREKKGEREILLSLALAQDLKRYLEEVRPQLAKNGEKALFISYKGKRLTRQAIFFNVRDYAKKAGLSGKINPTTLRYSSVARQRFSGFPSRKFQKLTRRLREKARKGF